MGCTRLFLLASKTALFGAACMRRTAEVSYTMPGTAVGSMVWPVPVLLLCGDASPSVLDVSRYRTRDGAHTTSCTRPPHLRKKSRCVARS